MADDIIRVSCSGLAYSAVGDCLAGLYSRSKLKRNPPKWFMTPLGGRHLHDASAQSFMESLKVSYEKPGTGQLSFSMPVRNLDAFSDWFYSHEGREAVPVRELSEELVDEECVISRDTPFILDRGFFLQKRTARAGGGPETAYFFDIYRMSFERQDELYTAASARPGCGLRLVTPDEVREGRMIRPGLTEDGAELGDLFKFFNLDKDGLDAVVTANAEDRISVSDISDNVYEFAGFD